MSEPTRCSGCYDSFSGPWCDNCDRWPCDCTEEDAARDPETQESASTASVAGERPSYGVLSWDWREQPDMVNLGTILTDVADLYLYEIDTGSDQYAVVISREPLADKGRAAYELNQRGDG